MKSIKLDKEKLKLERQEKELNQAEDERREAFFNRIRGDEEFQRYVVEGIIKKHLNDLTDTRIIQKSGANLSNESEVGRNVLLGIAARTKLENILSDLL